MAEPPAAIEVTTSFPPLAFLYGAVKPTIQIDDVRHRSQWGIARFEVPAGTHEVAVSYPYLLWKECGRNSIFVHLAPGETRRVSYSARVIRFVRGRIEADGP